MAYDPNGNALTVEDPRGNTTTNTYDAANRLATTTNAESVTTRFQYDTIGNRTRVTDRKSQTTQFQYDGLNRLTCTIDSAGKAETFLYNAENKEIRIDSLGRKTSYTYDSVHQLVGVNYFGAPAERLVYTIEHWRSQDYNLIRPHSSIGRIPPNSFALHTQTHNLTTSAARMRRQTPVESITSSPCGRVTM